MTSKLEQLQFGPNLDILRFLGDNSKAIGGLKVACTTYERNISRLEEVAHPVLGLRHLLASKKPVTAFAAMKRLGGAFDFPRGSLKTILILKRIIITNGNNSVGLPHYIPDLNSRVRDILSLASKLRVDAKEEDRQDILFAIISELKNIKCSGGMGISAITANIESILGLIPLIGAGDLASQRRSRDTILHILAEIYGLITWDVFYGFSEEINRAARANLDKLHDKLDEIEDLFTDKNMNTEYFSEFLFDILMYAEQVMNSLKDDHSTEAVNDKINYLGIFYWVYKQERKMGINYVNLEPVMDLIKACPDGSSQALSTLRLLLSRFFLDVAKRGRRKYNAPTKALRFAWEIEGTSR